MIVVWVDAWQMQCCGDPFAVGQEVAWTLSASPDTTWLEKALGADIAQQIEYAEDHHAALPDDAPVTRGTVLAIAGAYCLYEPVPGADSRIRRPVSGELREVARADGGNDETSGKELTGYVVELEPFVLEA